MFFTNLGFRIKDNPRKPALPIESMGSGFVSLFVVALLRALVDSAKGGNIFLLEEPETYLHEHFQEYAYSILCRLAENNQVIFTTHSKKFVDVFHPETIIRLDNPDSLGTRATATFGPVAVPAEIDGFALRSPDDFPKYLRTLEPNIGNVAFAKKVLIVEGPHDVLAYRSVFDRDGRFGLRNIAIVAAWGKDSIVSLVELCRQLGVEYFVIHDSDVEFDGCDPPDGIPELSPAQKAQVTKNRAIATAAGPTRVHRNVPNLEHVLGIPPSQKSAAAVFARLSALTITEVGESFPGAISQGMCEFVGVAPMADPQPA